MTNALIAKALFASTRTTDHRVSPIPDMTQSIDAGDSKPGAGVRGRAESSVFVPGIGSNIHVQPPDRSPALQYETVSQQESGNGQDRPVRLRIGIA